MTLMFAEIQPNFPNEDLSDANALFLELLMQNHATLQEHHAIAENSSFLYRYAHPALVSIMHSCFKTTEDAKAFEHGITAFESIAGFATLTFNRPGHSEAEVQKYMCDETKRFDPIVQLTETQERFVEEMKNTTKVIEASADRFFPHKSHYAIGGAAMAYFVETDIINRPDITVIHTLENL